MAARLGFAVVGLGGIADFHAQAAQALRGAGLVACFSRNEKKAKAFAEKFSCKAYWDYKAMLADPAIDVVTIASASGAHKDAAIAAAKAKKHVIAEKPLEVNPQRCRAMIKACKTNGVLLSTIFPSRFTDLSRVMKAAVEEQRLGTLVSASAYVKWHRAQDYYSSSDWKGTWAFDGGGALMNQGIHSLDFLIYLLGDPVEVSAYMNTPVKQGVEVETNLVAILRFPCGALGTIEASTEIYPGYKKRIEICGSAGSMSMVESELQRWDFKKKKAKDAGIRKRFSQQASHGGGASDPLAISFEGHRRQFQELVDVVKGKRDALSCDGEEGLRSVKVVNAIYKSAQTHKPVTIK